MTAYCLIVWQVFDLNFLLFNKNFIIRRNQGHGDNGGRTMGDGYCYIGINHTAICRALGAILPSHGMAVQVLKISIS